MRIRHETHLIADCGHCGHRHRGAVGRYTCECGCTQYGQPSQPPEIRARIEAQVEAFQARSQ